jgi:AraC-like DNA-binding protein
MTSIGGGYVWPNLAIISDGERVVLLARPTKPHPAEPLRYLSNLAAVVRATEFEGAIDLLLTRVLEQLRAEDIPTTNLDQIWSDVLAERTDPELAAHRRIEAMLGFDPDEADSAVVERLLADATRLGQGAVAEVAAHQPIQDPVPTADDISRVAAENGIDSKPGDAVTLSAAIDFPPRDEVPAWRRGAEAAHAVRAQEALGAAPISNARLCALAGLSPKALADRSATDFPFSFGLDESPSAGRVVLRSKWETGRRFDLARLIGDRVAGTSDDRLLPATRAHTYRQKLQRSFAAELLCPFSSLEDMLRGEYSSEALHDAAEHFNISELAVRTLLVNHGRLDREDLDGDIESTAAV